MAGAYYEDLQDRVAQLTAERDAANGQAARLAVDLDAARRDGERWVHRAAVLYGLVLATRDHLSRQILASLLGADVGEIVADAARQIDSTLVTLALPEPEEGQPS